jgi:molecular chaperone GrpE (heat shock protein)
MTDEVERLRDEVAKLKLQCKTLRQRLRREQADHQQTLRRLEVIRAAMAEKNEGS